MYLPDGAYRQEQPPTRSLLPPWILTIFVRERPEDPTESAEGRSDVDPIGEIVSEAAQPGDGNPPPEKIAKLLP